MSRFWEFETVSKLCLETVTVLLSVKSTYEPGASSIVQVDLLPKHDPRELKLTTAK